MRGSSPAAARSSACRQPAGTAGAAAARPRARSRRRSCAGRPSRVPRCGRAHAETFCAPAGARRAAAADRTAASPSTASAIDAPHARSVARTTRPEHEIAPAQLAGSLRQRARESQRQGSPSRGASHERERATTVRGPRPQTIASPPAQAASTSRAGCDNPRDSLVAGRAEEQEQVGGADRRVVELLPAGPRRGRVRRAR